MYWWFLLNMTKHVFSVLYNLVTVTFFYVTYNSIMVFVIIMSSLHQKKTGYITASGTS